MLVAKRSFEYGGRRYRAGDEFEAKSARDAKVLIAVKHASEASSRGEQPSAAPAKARRASKGTYERRDILAADVQKQPPRDANFVPAITGNAAVPASLAQSAELDSDGKS